MLLLLTWEGEINLFSRQFIFSDQHQLKTKKKNISASKAIKCTRVWDVRWLFNEKKNTFEGFAEVLCVQHFQVYYPCLSMNYFRCFMQFTKYRCIIIVIINISINTFHWKRKAPLCFEFGSRRLFLLHWDSKWLFHSIELLIKMCWVCQSFSNWRCGSSEFSQCLRFIISSWQVIPLKGNPREQGTDDS